MKPDPITSWRLTNQQISAPAYRDPAEVVHHLGAMQAQDYAGALWSIGLRLPDATEAAVENSVSERRIVRTWPMRGTLHFVAPEDVRWMLHHLTPRIMAGAIRRQNELELDHATFSKAEKTWSKALAGGRWLPRSAMLEVLSRSGIPVDPHRGYHLLWRLAQQGLLCFGPREGKEQTFTLLEEWVPPVPMISREEALARLALRYFRSHGPARAHDLAWWAGLTMADARLGTSLAGAELGKEMICGQEYWASEQTPALPARTSRAYLLPGFDEYMLGYQDRSAALSPEHAQKIIPGGNGIFMPTLVSNGKVVGTWKRTVRRKSVDVTANPFIPLPKTQLRSFTEAAARYGSFLGVSATFS